MKKLAAAYIRVSTDDQVEYSPSAQLEDILDYAKLHDIFIPENFIFIDEGISGRDAEKRPGFMEMIRQARKKTNDISFILVHKYDRFSRKKEDAVLYKALLKKDGVKVISIKEPIPDDDKFAVIYESMLEAMAEYYSLNLAEEVKKTMVRKAQKGEWQSIAPFGYKNVNKTLEVVPEEAKWISYIFDQYLNHDKSFFSLAKELNAMGVKTHRGNLMENRTIQYILCNPAYCGYARWTPTGKTRRNFNNPDSFVVKASHTPIIEEDIFLKTQEKYALNKRKTTAHKRPMTEGKHWLSGLVKCSNCGRSLIIYRTYKDGNFSLQCGGYNHGQCLVSHSVTSAILIPEILNALKYINTGNYAINITKVKKENTELQITESLLLKTKQKRTNAKEAYLASIDSIEEYKNNKATIEQELSELTKNIDRLKSTSYSAMDKKNFKRRIEGVYDTLMDTAATMEEKKLSAHTIIEKIVYQKSSNKIELFLFDS